MKGQHRYEGRTMVDCGIRHETIQLCESIHLAWRPKGTKEICDAMMGGNWDRESRTCR